MAARTAAILILGPMLGLGAILAGCAAVGRSDPAAATPDLSLQEARGERVFMRACNQCHPRGQAGLAPPIFAAIPDALVRLQVRQGMGAMPAFPEAELSAQEMDDLLAYLNAAPNGG